MMRGSSAAIPPGSQAASASCGGPAHEGDDSAGHYDEGEHGGDSPGLVGHREQAVEDRRHAGHGEASDVERRRASARRRTLCRVHAGRHPDQDVRDAVDDVLADEDRHEEQQDAEDQDRHRQVSPAARHGAERYRASLTARRTPVGRRSTKNAMSRTRRAQAAAAKLTSPTTPPVATSSRSRPSPERSPASTAPTAASMANAMTTHA